jgi:predicted permease
MRDLLLAFRQLRKSPAFTAVAVLSLGLGIGANTAIFSLVNDFLLRSLPVRHPEELVLFRLTEGVRGRLSRSGENNGSIDPATGRSSSTSFSLLIFERFRTQRSALSEIFAFAPFSQVNVLVDGQPELTVSAQLVSGTYHAGLGVPAVLGRTLREEDDKASAAPVAVISYRYWRNRFGHDSAVLGKTLQINRVPTTIVGVTPQGFAGTMQAGESPDISVPLALYLRFQPDRAARAQPWYWWIRIMGRLAPGATAAQARSSLEPIFQETAREGWLAGQSLDKAPAEMPDDSTLVADPGAQGENDLRRQYRRSLRILMGLVSLVLAAACANVANLLLARGAGRRREIALRLALGASRGRIVRQLLAESLVLAFAGAALGTVLASWSRDLLLALRPFGNASVVLDLPLDARVLGFTIASAVATALLFGVAPSLRATRVDLTADFQGGTRSLVSGGRSRLSQALMVVQIALSLVLLVSTGLFVRTLRNLGNVDAGFNRRGLILFAIDANSAGYTREQFAALQSRVQERLERLPGVHAATFSSVALLSRLRQNKRITVPGYAPPSGTSMIVNTNGLASNFFTAMELPLVLGRGFDERDNLSAPRVAVVNQAFARTYCSGDNPVGRTIGIGANPSDQVEIVGVAADAKYTELRGATPATIYLPALQRLDGNANFALRLASPAAGERDTVGTAAALFPAIRAAVREIDPTLPVLNLRTQDEQIDRLHSQERLFARLSGFFGLLALALACVGLYGLMSYAVLRRTAEIGLRMALGALPGHVMGMILRESLALVCLGVAAGIAAAYGASRLIASMLFELSPTDPLTYGSVAGILVTIALVASFLPARRASRVDPMIAFRVD